MFKQVLAMSIVPAMIFLSMPRIGSAGATCNPVCAPQPNSNSGGTLHGLNRANEVAGDHGVQGRTNAQQKQDENKPGGSGVVSGGPGSGTGTGGSTGGGGSTPGPCTGC